jgi:hypothetical protein
MGAALGGACETGERFAPDDRKRVTDPSGTFFISIFGTIWN